MIRRIFHPALAPGRIRLDADNSHYAARVLRLQLGDEIEVFDGGGQVARGRIANLARAVDVECGAPTTSAAPKPHVELVLSPIKGPRADWAVEKLTEIGVGHLRFVNFERSVTNPSLERLERWQRICQAAARQCGRNHLPTLHTPLGLQEFLARVQENPASQQTRVVARPGTSPLGQLASRAEDVSLVIGPEGGLTAEELETLTRSGYTEVSLSRWTLRAETAAIVGASLLMREA